MTRSSIVKCNIPRRTGNIKKQIKWIMYNVQSYRIYYRVSLFYLSFSFSNTNFDWTFHLSIYHKHRTTSVKIFTMLYLNAQKFRLFIFNQKSYICLFIVSTCYRHVHLKQIKFEKRETRVSAFLVYFMA